MRRPVLESTPLHFLGLCLTLGLLVLVELLKRLPWKADIFALFLLCRDHLVHGPFMPLRFALLLRVAVLVFLVPCEMVSVLLLESVLRVRVVLLGSIRLLRQHLLESGSIILPVCEILDL